MTEIKTDYETRAANLETENTRLTVENRQQAAEIAELRANLESALNLVRAYETSADAIRAVVKTLPRLVVQEARNAGN